MRYEPAAANPMDRQCRTGTRALAQAVKAVYPELTVLEGPYGCFNRRKIAGSSAWSLHAEGRAFDAGVPGPQNGTGWALACWLVQQRQYLGVQRVIWDRHIWDVTDIDHWRKLRSGNMHLDHVHIEQYRADSVKHPDVQTFYMSILRSEPSRGR